MLGLALLGATAAGSDHSNRIRVRLGPDRLLETECLGK